ncbi:MAG: GcrA cell cycle regulator [Hyphomicrobiales bacterium]|nr:GcrA cell cycle regulator [Hyphomicrobiales bacterium]MCY4039530.1 GcrA cell cycle regulator [Hyphomicrobiales bacterium]
MSWTDERISLLKRLWDEGKSAREIATVLGEGVTRNAVIGKVNRMKLAARKAASGKPKPASSNASKPRKAASKPKTSAPPRRTAESTMAPPSPPPSPPPQPKSPPPPPPPPPAAEPTPPPPKESQEPLEPVAPLIREPDEDGDVDEDIKGASLFGSGGCKWPIGHPGEEDFHFCGEEKHGTFPYCEDHAKEAYQMVDRRRRSS